MKLSARLIKDARTAAGLTQAELAESAGTSQPTIAAYESGEKIPTVETLERLLGVAGMEVTATGVARSRAGSLGRLVHDRRKEIIALAAKYHAANVRIFGSIARDEASDFSDVDLLVDMKAGRSLLDQVRLQRALSELLGVQVDVITSSGLLPRDRKTVLKEAVPL
jgi:predicted nucleotidyltransferase/DNA-binding XRE family transcriptional regulator